MTTSEPPQKLTFREAAVRSGLVSVRKLDKVTELIKSDDDALVAATLVKSGVLTEYQSQQLLAGRTKLTLGPYKITDWIGQGGICLLYTSDAADE